ncbi:MAG: RnfABCDGE type electron transport complex subunit B [Candidatus Gygaella obscura]|nr:RnfABCDGE type electron transport complex subunit B [Candidatus Gygaella obscura]
MSLLPSIITMASMGVIFGAGLALASKKLRVAKDPRLEQVFALLPQLNCGVCGYAGCAGFAQALIGAETTINRCSVLNESAAKEIASMLGIDRKESVKKIAVLCCSGDKDTVRFKYEYNGSKDCLAANLLHLGPKECVFGCIGFGTCADMCSFNGITMQETGLPKIDIAKCKACSKCLEACPKDLFKFVPEDKPIYIACSSHYAGKQVKDVCNKGCIACKICERVCKYDAIHVIDNLAVIDYNKCTLCGECIKECPVKVIKKL